MTPSDISTIITTWRTASPQQLAADCERFLDSDAWEFDGFEWKCEHRTQVSDYIQGLAQRLPASLPNERMLYLAGEYELSLVYLPGSIDLGTTALVTFWNRHVDAGHATAEEEQELREYLAHLCEHPDGDHVEEIVARARSLKG